MSESFVPTFMRVALHVTDTERALAVNTDLMILDSVNLQQADIESERFTGVEAIQRAFNSGEPVITNNLKMESSQAPTTNTNFTDLRVVIALPLMGYGAVYLDQPIRGGMVPRERIDRLMALGEHVVQTQQTDLSAEELLALYREMD